MESIFIQTMIMFALAFAISMLVALLIYWIRRMLTSVKVNSFFDEKSKLLVRRAVRIHNIHDKSLKIIADGIEHEMQTELFDFYHGVNTDFEPAEDYNGSIRTTPRRKRTTKKHKNI